jgi:hypothetical protein
LRQRLPVYHEFVPALMSRPGLLSEKLQAARDLDDLAKEQAA